MRHHLALGLVAACVLGWIPAPAAHLPPATGAIDGRVTFDGRPPPPAAMDEGGGAQPVLYVDRSGALRYAVVFLPDARPAAGAPRGPVTMNQHNFTFVPQVMAVRAGQVVRFTNDDAANHNVRGRGSSSANTFSINTAAGSPGRDTHTFVAASSGDPVQLSCDIHPWMAAWVYVFNHDQFAVSGADGRFRIDGVPPGRHRMAVRQPSGRLARDRAVDVPAGGTARLDVRFTAEDLGMPLR